MSDRKVQVRDLLLWLILLLISYSMLWISQPDTKNPLTVLFFSGHYQLYAKTGESDNLVRTVLQRSCWVGGFIRLL